MFFNKKKLKITDHLQQSSELSSRGVSLLFNEICARNSYIEQLTEIGLVDEVLPNGVLIEWEKFYAINSDLEHQDSLPLLAMPEFINLTPILSSSGALTDGTFQVNITGWRNGDGIRLSFQDAKLRFNPVIDYQHRVYLLTYPVWHLISAILEFAAISSAQKTTENNYRHWGKIRRLALNANCVLDNFLSKTVVLTPEKLHLQLDQDADVVTISPTFIEAPSDWLERFDHLPNVPDYYHLPQTDGSQIEIALTEPVKQVLQEIKRMPKRTVRGKRAQAFLRNPYACLGNLALGVITPESYEQSLEQSGIIFYRFTLGAKQDAKGNIINITMQLIANRVTPVFNNTTFEFSTPDELVQLINEIEIQLQEQAPCFNWKGYEIELCGDSDRQYQNLKQWYQSWLTPINLLAYEDIFQFSEYSKRVLEIGVRKPYYSPFILKNDDEKSPWIPTELTITIGTVQEHTGEITAYLPIRNEDDINRLEDALQEAKNHSATEFNYDGLPKPINIFEAEQICQLARGSFEAIKHGKQPEQLQKTTLRGQKTLVIQTNITEIEYSENSQTSKPIVFDKTSTDYLELPEALKVTLKPHQTVGVAWLQHLWRHCPTHYAGCMVADDMGLGKTLQLLTFIHWYLAKPTPLPVLVVAPVSLLDNWQNELQKFFHPGVVKLLTLYGKTLQQKKIAQSLIDERLREESLNNFLADNWLEDANVVLTTYETLRDLSI